MGPPPPPLLLAAPPPALLVVLPPEAAAAAAVTVIWADPDFVESDAETAVIVTVAGDGTVMGAVYMPDAEIMPTMALPPAAPLTLQFTVVLEEPVTAAANA